jgi:energy-coupling factor transporter transmembrane protein EcfT
MSYGQTRGVLISLFVFVAWAVVATGWVRLLAILWLVYPVVVAWQIYRSLKIGRHS